MSHTPIGRGHAWLWAFGVVFIYVASCAPVESWYDSRHARAPMVVPHPGPPAEKTGGGGEGGDAGSPQSLPPDFQITEVTFTENVDKPKWMQYFYAPVHWLAEVPLIGGIFQKYREWCGDLI